MTPFAYVRPQSVVDASALAQQPGGHILAGGTNLVDLMKENVTLPIQIVDISRLPLKRIEALEGGGLRLGALATNAQTAYDLRVAKDYPLLSSAILAGASPQLRNAATNGGNLNQRTRCLYFYDLATPCNKREPGAGCSAIGGLTRMHGILGTSEHCIATHPSDMCVALAALDAQVQLSGSEGRRTVAFADYHRLPGEEPARDNILRPGELVWAIDLPPPAFTSHYSYLKLRDRLSYAFALVSVAAALRFKGDEIAEARIALGGVAHKPWRLPGAEQVLVGQKVSESAFGAAADILLSGAKGQGDNDFKLGLVRKAVVRALRQAAAGTPQSQSDKRVV